MAQLPTLTAIGLLMLGGGIAIGTAPTLAANAGAPYADVDNHDDPGNDTAATPAATPATAGSMR